MGKRRRKRTSLLSSLVLLAVLILAASWFSYIPYRLNPLPALDLSKSNQWFIDARLSALRYNKTLCKSVLVKPHIVASPVPSRGFENDCGWQNAVRMSRVDGISLPASAITCEMAAAVSIWATDVVQPAAKKLFGSRVISMRQMGVYSCRNIIGNSVWKSKFRSQHAFANAIDIGGFKLANGTTVSVLRDWRKDTAKGKFLREVFDGACGIFRVALSPNFNRAHRDHFHFDRGFMWTCR